MSLWHNAMRYYVWDSFICFSQQKFVQSSLSLTEMLLLPFRFSRINNPDDKNRYIIGFWANIDIPICQSSIQENHNFISTISTMCSIRSDRFQSLLFAHSPPILLVAATTAAVVVRLLFLSFCGILITDSWLEWIKFLLWFQELELYKRIKFREKIALWLVAEPMKCILWI